MPQTGNSNQMEATVKLNKCLVACGGRNLLGLSELCSSTLRNMRVDLRAIKNWCHLTTASGPRANQRTM